jgi:hypothetical protein
VTKVLSPQLLLDFIGEPEDSPRRAQSGIYTHYVLGTAPRRVHLILLDVRTNRDPYFGQAQDFLGAEQWAWLERVLRETPAELTVIGSGLQVVSKGDIAIAESWYKLPQSQARLLALLAAARVEGALIISGDVHFAEISRLTCPALGYPLYDVTSSGLTHSWGGLLKRTVVDICLMGAERLPGTTFVSDKNWGELEVGWALAADGALDRRRTTVTMRIFGVEDGAERLAHAVPLAELTRGGSGGAAVHVDEALAAATEQCAHARLDAGVTPACAAFMASCEPRLRAWHHAKYFVGHFFVLGGLLGTLLLVVTAPIIAWVAGPYLPGKRPLAFAVVVAAYGAFAAFLDSIH